MEYPVVSQLMTDEIDHLCYFFNVYLFLRKRERQVMSRGEAERERGRHQNLKQALGFELSAQSLTQGSHKLTNCEIIT